ncbi:MAG: mechanosensitive ion channel domain-containing protein [Planctomycetota bacterium]
MAYERNEAWLEQPEEAGAETAEAAVSDASGEAEAAGEQAEAPINEAMEGAISRFTDGDVSQSDLMFAWDAIGFPIVKAIVLIIAVLIVSGWVRKLVLGITRKANVDETLARFFGNMAKYLVMVLGGLAILSTLGVDTTSFAAVIAAAGFAIGLALSGLLGNFSAGIMLLIFRPFKVGDVVNAGGITGKVEAIELFTTVFDTPDNRRIVVPNGTIFGGNIETITFHPTRRVDVAVGTDYPADIDEARRVLEKVAAEVEGGLDDPAPVVYLNELGGSSIDWAVRVWSKTEDYWAVRERLTRNIKVALDEANIGIPFPQMDVHIDGELRQG